MTFPGGSPFRGYARLRETRHEHRQGCDRLQGIGQDHSLLRGGGPIATAVRSTSGYRVYTQADMLTLRFIKRARELGFSIERIRRLLDLWQDRSRASRVKRLALDHIAEIRAKIAATTSMRDAVEEIADACDGDERPECPILRDLEDAAVQPLSSRVG